MRKITYFKLPPKILLYLGILVVPAVIVFILAPNFISQKRAGQRPESELRKYAEEVLDKCSSVSYKPPCYDEEVPKLLDFITMEDAFQVTRFVQEQDPTYLYCHVLGHNIAEKETQKDLSKWKDVVARCPTTMCNNGCPHGALMERFKNDTDYLTEEQIESIKLDLADVCEPRDAWNPREIERSMCYHALGHLHMYITNADLRKSAKLCEEIGTKPDGRNYVQTCTEGVFMSIYQPLGPDDIALVKNVTPSKEKMPEFCAQFKDSFMSFHACHKEAWAIFREKVTTPDTYYKFCTYTDDKQWQDACFRSLMNPITDDIVISRNDVEGLISFCRPLPSHVKNICIYSTVHRLMQVDPKLVNKALELCSMSLELGNEVQQSCYGSLLAFGSLGFIRGSTEFYEYCRLLPEPWREQCANRQ